MATEDLKHDYIHGYDEEEQDRLVAQARYWGSLVYRKLNYEAGQQVLEIGCGVGANLDVLSDQFPDANFSGIDISKEQINYAEKFLASRGKTSFELQVGNATKLPWQDETFDHVYIMWVVEHFIDPSAMLAEALRVLKPGGQIMVTETDYASIQVCPVSEDYDVFLKAFNDAFSQHGDPYVGRKLGQLLSRAGFKDVDNEMVGMNYWMPTHEEVFTHHVNYIAGFIEPILGDIAQATGVSVEQLEKGLNAFKTAPQKPDASMSHVVYRCEVKLHV